MRNKRQATVYEVLSLVERGWRGARECSLVLSRRAIPVTHLIKGAVSPEVLAMIEPHPALSMLSVRRGLFRLTAWGLLVAKTLTGRLQWLLIDQERTLTELAWWCRVWGLTPVLIQETAEGYDCWVDGRQVPLDELFKKCQKSGQATFSRPQP